MIPRHLLKPELEHVFAEQVVTPCSLTLARVSISSLLFKQLSMLGSFCINTSHLPITERLRINKSSKTYTLSSLITNSNFRSRVIRNGWQLKTHISASLHLPNQPQNNTNSTGQLLLQISHQNQIHNTKSPHTNSL